MDPRMPVCSLIASHTLQSWRDDDQALRVRRQRSSLCEHTPLLDNSCLSLPDAAEGHSESENPTAFDKRRTSDSTEAFQNHLEFILTHTHTNTFSDTLGEIRIPAKIKVLSFFITNILLFNFQWGATNTLPNSHTGDDLQMRMIKY